MIAVVALPRLPTEVGRAEGAQGGGASGIVVNEVGAGFVVRSVLPLMDVSEEALALGVRPGMRILDAQKHAPMLRIDVVTQARLAEELAVVAEVLLSCAPVVEPLLPLPRGRGLALPLYAVALDLTGMARPVPRILIDVQRACARLGHRALVAASPGTRLSMALARALSRQSQVSTLVIKPVDVPRVLKRLPLDTLELSADLAASLMALGARTAADVAVLLQRGGMERLGAEAPAILETLQARSTPLRGLVPPTRIIEELELDHPVEAIEPLLFILNSLCNRVCLRVRARQARIAEVTLRLLRRHGDSFSLVMAFPDPLLDDKAMLRALQVRLERSTLGGPTDKVVLEVSRLAAQGPRQLPLEPGAQHHVQTEEALRGLLAELSAEIGTERVGCLVVTNDPRPEHMTRLVWPAPPPPSRPPAPDRRRPRRAPSPPHQAVIHQAVTRGGRFLASWPWPLRLLPKPLRLARDLVIAQREELGVLEGESPNDEPYARRYQLLVLEDGRRALGLHDAELQETWLHGWFD